MKISVCVSTFVGALEKNNKNTITVSSASSSKSGGSKSGTSVHALVNIVCIMIYKYYTSTICIILQRVPKPGIHR